jgi:hypothetical protein
MWILDAHLSMVHRKAVPSDTAAKPQSSHRRKVGMIVKIVPGSALRWLNRQCVEKHRAKQCHLKGIRKG